MLKGFQALAQKLVALLDEGANKRRLSGEGGEDVLFVWVHGDVGAQGVVQGENMRP